MIYGIGQKLEEIEVELANQEIPSKLIGPRKKTRAVVGVMCRIG